MKQKRTATPVIRNYKDTVFRRLFSGKKELLSLYNAVNETHYTNPDELEIVTLDNAVYMNMKNDLAFLIDFHLYLYEHQSTINPNMPLRFLQYVAREYEKLIDATMLYTGTPVHVPAPHFIVFYNGITKQPERSIQKLSDVFYHLADEPQLELKVLMLNINPGSNPILIEQCKTLKEYTQYVSRVRDYASHMELPKAVQRAVNECIQEGILSDFLLKNKAEVISMSIFEYNEEKTIAAIRSTERESGRAEGLSEGQSASVLVLLEDFGTIPDSLKQQIYAERDSAVLKKWLKLASKADSLEQFMQNM